MHVSQPPVQPSRTIRALKRLRSSQPFNWLTTTGLRSVMAVTGARSEKVIRHLHRVGHVQVQLPNRRTLQLWSRGDDWVSNQLFWRGWDGYEGETTRFFFQLAGQAQVVLDVGAYVGFYSLLAGHANPDARVFAFEPLPTVFNRLQKNVHLNGLNHVECLNRAAGDTNGLAEFYHMNAELPTSSSLSYEFMQHVDELQCSQVQTIRLDEFVDERGLQRVDLVKIDTESTKPQVLRGMSTTLERFRPDIVCEILQRRGSEAAVQEILEPLGYRFYLLTPNGPEQKETVEGHPEWLNYLFSVRSAGELFEDETANDLVEMNSRG